MDGVRWLISLNMSTSRSTSRFITFLTLALAPIGTLAADTTSFEKQLRPVLETHCLKCHGGDKPKGEFALDRLPPDFRSAANRSQWRAVIERIESGEMPPKEKPR